LGSGVAVSRGFWLSFVAVSGAFAVLLAAYPSFDVQVAARFFDPNTAKFPLSVGYEWNLVRRVANMVPFLLLAPGIFALLRKLVYPDERMLIAPSVVLFLIGSFLLGPGVTSNLLLKENWGRPRPNGVQQFAGSAAFQPWWRPGGECRRNCFFVSGEASQAFWTVAPASLAPPQLRPIALGGAVLFGVAVGGLRVVFGRHFVSDIIFAGLITVAIILRSTGCCWIRCGATTPGSSGAWNGLRWHCIGSQAPSREGRARRWPGLGPPYARPAGTCRSASPAYSRRGSWPVRARARLFPWRPTSKR
jgi:membrane-associated PAP2 superfamily phosphatase